MTEFEPQAGHGPDDIFTHADVQKYINGFSERGSNGELLTPWLAKESSWARSISRTISNKPDEQFDIIFRIAFRASTNKMSEDDPSELAVDRANTRLEGAVNAEPEQDLGDIYANLAAKAAEFSGPILTASAALFPLPSIPLKTIGLGLGAIGMYLRQIKKFDL